MHQRLINWYISKAALPFWLVFAADCSIIYLSGLAAYALNHGLAYTVGMFGPLIATMLVYMLCFMVGIRIFHTYSGIIRHTSIVDLARIIASLVVGTSLIVFMRMFFHADSFLLTIRIRDLLLLTLIAASLMCGLRIVAKIIYDIYLRNANGGGAYGLNHDTLINLEMKNLLQREPIEIDTDEIRTTLQGKRILITGAAGSIGSELAKIIADAAPSQLILIDIAESPLHSVRTYMEQHHHDLRYETIVANICHSHRMERIFSTFHPELVFHAAAYKHVPMMENNPVESVLNNIDGTKKLADLAVKYGVEKFVMISTDKAVNPTNVMGCSKRICEMYCQSLSTTDSSCQFITTRFGNVLGSNGSVIPTFRDQIRHGGPVMVTHPKIIRYFMLIPEACNLVLEAATIGAGGEIFAFDMGKPVKIVDLAKRMIALSGRLDVKIEYTGLRPGEKLYEEILTDREVVCPTSHPQIWRAKVVANDYIITNNLVSALIATARTYDAVKTVRIMKQIVPEYISSDNSPYAFLDKKESVPDAESGTKYRNNNYITYHSNYEAVQTSTTHQTGSARSDTPCIFRLCPRPKQLRGI